MRLVLGVDSSTQSTKVELRELDSGRLVGSGRAPHPPTTPPASEQDPRDWWQALTRACAQLDPEHRAQVVAVSVAAQQHGLVMLDSAGEPLGAALLWNDTRSASVAAELVERIGAARWARAVGSVPVAAFTVTKLAFMNESQPELVARCARIGVPHDYLTWRLTGRWVTDRGDASGTGWFDPSTTAYRPDLLAEAGGSTELLPRVLGPAEPAGELIGEAAAELGLRAGIVVGPGTGDNMAAALGLGLGVGDVAISLGTSGTVYAVSERPTHDPSGQVAGFADAAGRFLPLVCTLNATRVTDTLAGLLGTDAEGFALLALSADPEDEPVVLVPYFDGERTPDRPEATGTLGGLTTATSRAAVALAAHDGVLCGLLDGLDALLAAGVPHGGRLLLIGGGARSAAYRQRAADLSGGPVLIPAIDEAVATGAAVQAAVVVTGDRVEDLARRWGLGSGTLVTPRVTESGVRQRYAALAAQRGLPRSGRGASGA